MLPTNKGHLLINDKTKEYIFTDSETWEGDWKQRYPHIANEDYLYISNPSIWPYDVVNGLPYTYGLCRDGMLVDLYHDSDTTKEELAAAKRQLKHDHDVVSIHTYKIKAYQS